MAADHIGHLRISDHHAQKRDSHYHANIVGHLCGPAESAKLANHGLRAVKLITEMDPPSLSPLPPGEGRIKNTFYASWHPQRLIGY